MSTPKRTFLLVAGVLLMVILGMSALHRSRGQKALARYKAELIAKGEKLSYPELVGPPSTNSLDVQAKLLGATAQIRKGKFAASSLCEIHYVGPGKAQPIWKEQNPWDPTSPELASAGWAEFAKQVIAAEAALGQIREAAVGEDATDDRGNPEPAEATAKPDLWQGRDVVWPEAASK